MAIYLAATALALIPPATREVLLICYLPAIVLAVLAGGAYAGLGVAIGGGLAIWWRLHPIGAGEDALVLMLYVDVAVLLLYVMDLVNRSIDALVAERDRARLLLHEAQHRTANNLMFVSGFLRAERRRAQGDPARAIAGLDIAIHRLEAFSSLHRQLSGAGEAREALPVLLRRLCDGLVEASGAGHVALSMEIGPAELDFEQTALLSFLLAEIVTNALKHAFDGRERGTLLVRLASADDMHVLEVRDDGSGLAPDGRAGTGHRLLHMLAGQLGGTLTMTNDAGLHTRITFPRRDRAPKASPPDLATAPAAD